MILKQYDLDFSLFENAAIETIIENACSELIQNGELSIDIVQDPFMPLDPAIFDTLSTGMEASPIPQSIWTILSQWPIKQEALQKILDTAYYDHNMASNFPLDKIMYILTQQSGATNVMELLRLVATDTLHLFNDFGFNNHQLFRMLAQPLGFENLRLLERVIQAQNNELIPALTKMLQAGINIEDITKVLAQPLGYKNLKKLLAAWTVEDHQLGSWHALTATGLSTNELIEILAQPMGFYYFNALSILVATTSTLQTAQTPEENLFKKLVLKKGGLLQIKIAIDILKKDPSFDSTRLFSFLTQPRSDQKVLRMTEIPLEKLMAHITDPRKQKRTSNPRDTNTASDDNSEFQNKRLLQLRNRALFDDSHFNGPTDAYSFAFTQDTFLPQPDLSTSIRNLRQGPTTISMLNSRDHWFTHRTVLTQQEKDSIFAKRHPFVREPHLSNAVSSKTEPDYQEIFASLYELSRNYERNDTLEDKLHTDAFLDDLKQPAIFKSFFDALLAIRPSDAEKYCHTSALYWLTTYSLSQQMLEKILNTKVFLEHLKEPAFFNLFFDALLAIRPSDEKKGSLTSALYYLATCVNHRPILMTILQNQTFQLALENPIFFHRFFETLLIKRQDSAGSNANTSALYWLTASVKGRKILETLFTMRTFQKELQNPDFFKSFFNTLIAKRPNSAGSDANTSALSQLNANPLGQKILKPIQKTPIFLLWRVLYELDLLSLLQQTNLRTLFKHPQIQQLIHMQQIKPAWFLFIAIHQPEYDASLIDFFLAQESISVWATNTSARLAYHLVDDLFISDDHKIDLKERLHHAIQLQTAQHAQKNICLKLNSTLCLPPKQETNIDFILPGEPLSEDTDIQKVHRYIQWILAQEQLDTYHPAFQNLSTNPDIAQLQDYTELLSLLQRICGSMDHAIKQQKRMVFYIEWIDALKNCRTGIFDCLHHMHLALLGIHHPFTNYFANTITTTTTYYHQLLQTKLALEIHAPQGFIHSYLGCALQTFPTYDPYLLSWSPIQQHWVAQSAAKNLLHSEDTLFEHLAQPILDAVAHALWSTDADNPRIAVTEIAISELTSEHPLMIALELFNESPLLQTPFNILDLLTCLFVDDDRTPEILEEIISEVRSITPINSQASYAQLQSRMKVLFSQWLAAEPQHGIPQKKIIHTFSEILWQYLTAEAINPIVTPLLQKLPDATDAAALIHYCLDTHAEQISQIQWHRLFEPVSKNTTASLFSLLVANPFYTEWLLGFKIQVHTITPRAEDLAPSTHITFRSTTNPSKFAEIFMPDEHRLNIPTHALETALIQPGTLFFWLFYLQQDPLHSKLFQAIEKFIFAQSHRLAQYDSLLPLLLAMQNSSIVSVEEKTLVRSFLLARMNEQLQHKHSAYWQTSCYLVDSREEMIEGTRGDMAEYPWLLDSTQHHATVDMARCFLLNQGLPTNPTPGTAETLNQVGLFATATTTSAALPTATQEDTTAPAPQ